MGAGFALFVAAEDADRVVAVGAQGAGARRLDRRQRSKPDRSGSLIEPLGSNTTASELGLRA